MNKQEMVDLLVSHEGTGTRRVGRGPDFAKLPERLLKRELQLRGLIDFDEPEPCDEDDAGFGGWGDELRGLISRSPRRSLDSHYFD